MSTAQQSVHLTGGISSETHVSDVGDASWMLARLMRHFRALSTPAHAAARQSCSRSFIDAHPPAMLRERKPLGNQKQRQKVEDIKNMIDQIENFMNELTDMD
jgi:hypothetical protein